MAATLEFVDAILKKPKLLKIIDTADRGDSSKEMIEGALYSLVLGIKPFFGFHSAV